MANKDPFSLLGLRPLIDEPERKRLPETISKFSKDNFSSKGILMTIEDYNKKDCQSTEELHKFLIKQHRLLKLAFRNNNWGKSKDEESKTNFERELEVLAKTLRKAIPDPLKDPLA